MNNDSIAEDEMLAWEVVPSVSRLAFVGRMAGRAVGIVDWDGHGYRAVTCGGVMLGTFAQVEQAERALSEHLHSFSPNRASTPTQPLPPLSNVES